MAGQFTLSFELAESVHRSNPLRLLLVVLAAATVDLWALAGATVAFFLYILSAAWALIALVKPVLPCRTGAWVTPGGDLNMGIILEPQGQEILGYWIIPIAAGLAVACFLLANMLLRVSGRRLMQAVKRWTQPHPY